MQSELKRQSHTKSKKPSFREPLFVLQCLNQCTMYSNKNVDEDSDIRNFITSLGDDSLDFAPYIKCVSLTANQFVIQNGQLGDEYFGLVSGQVNINETLFGKESLIGEPYTQDVFTVEDSKFLFIKRQDFIDVTNKGKLKDNTSKLDFLKETQLFGKLSKQTIKAMLSDFELIVFKKGQIVYREGENSDFVYLIKEGEFELLKQFVVHEQSKYKLLPVTTIGKFEQFGDLDCLLNNTRQFTVKCKEAAICLRVSSQNFYAIIQKNQHQIENYVNNLMRVQTLSRQKRLKTASNVVSGNRDLLLGVSDSRRQDRDTSLQLNIETKRTHSRFAEIYSNSNRKKIKVRYATLHDQQAAVNRCASKNPESSNRFKQLNQIKGQLFDEVIIPDRIKRKYQHQLMDLSQQTIRRQQLIIRTQNNYSQIIAQKQS